ncbi:ComF family protein [Listeria sp. FSL L7-1517]|uniref:ComF family protein n=1 Tax=Listeria immobilis TaxID=2713502 RepID=UPI00164D5F2A|nr:ComF family protein [Listeria immobilis]MBC6297500.1 ComF family protein [Listeria immobilis]
MTSCLLCFQALKSEVSWDWKWLFGEKRLCCRTCFSSFEALGKHLCERCSKESAVSVCNDCQKKQFYLDSNKSIFRYNDFAKNYMKKYKFQGDYIVGAIFQQELKQIFIKSNAIIVPIPISKERKLERGFNQTTGMLKQAGIKYEELLARKHSEKQSKKTKKERLESEQVFYLQREICHQQEIVLFDDIYTTGSTLNLAAQQLKKAGVKRVSAVTIFR